MVVALLESLQEGGAVGGAATRVLEELVLICRRTHREKLRYIPPLPNWLPELEKLNEVGGRDGSRQDAQAWQARMVAADKVVHTQPYELGKSCTKQTSFLEVRAHGAGRGRALPAAAVLTAPTRPARPPAPGGPPSLRVQTLAKERGKPSTQEQVELLMASLADDSQAVRATALRELRSVLSSRREWALGLLGSPAATGGADRTVNAASSGAATSLLTRLMSALLKCCDPEVHSQASLQAQQACAECLGILGAVDPDRVAVELQPPAPRCT